MQWKVLQTAYHINFENDFKQTNNYRFLVLLGFAKGKTFLYYCIKSAVNITQIGLECRKVISELAAQLTKISLMNTFSNMKYRLESIEQCCAAHIVQCCQQYCSAWLSLN